MAITLRLYGMPPSRYGRPLRGSIPPVNQTLLQEFVPRPIASQRAYRRTLTQIDGIIRKAKRSRAEDDLLELLATLVGDERGLRHGRLEHEKDPDN